MDITKDIQPMTHFRNHSAAFMAHLRSTGRPLILTVNGKAAAVVQDAEAYQRLLDLAAEASAAEGIRQGLDDLANGRTQPARAVFAGLAPTVVYRVELSERAVRDLRALFDWINAAASGQAQAWFEGLESAILSLETNPARGSHIPENAVLRQLLYGHRRNVYRIIYGVDEAANIVTVIHVRHTAREPAPDLDISG